MTGPRRSIDKVRASREGHEFHEAWTARKALQLLWPDSPLTVIAVEGLSPSDQARASAHTVEIADLALYYGDFEFERAARTTIAQFKYSIARQDDEFRASDAKKTIQKFGNAYREYKKRYGAQAVQDKLDFQLITNQAIYDPLNKAIYALARGLHRSGETERQAKQFQAAAGLTGRFLAAFAEKFKLIGRSGNLPETKQELASLLVDWSATSDSIATARLGQLRDLVRKKAGYAGTSQNLIARTDILAVLQINDAKDLLPCEPELPEVGRVIEREQFSEALALISNISKPLLVHAAGGVGKTVFMHALATSLTKDHEVVFFDCFGGGAYRSPEDARHLPRRGLVHIANTLAFRGLCDPVLPDSPDVETLLRTFRRRLVQCVDTMSRMTPGRELVLFIDAIDNAEIAARPGSDHAFPVKILDSLAIEPIAGVKLVISCRTERKPDTYATCCDFPLRPFSKDETACLLQARLDNVSQTEINVAQARSGGNPRVIDYLLKTGRGLLDESEIDKAIELDDLIEARIDDALATARQRGYEQQDLDAFLAGLAVLPPPVPLEEYAGAHGIDISAVESFASDLRPLLERSNHGLMFRDEPTETLVRKQYSSSVKALRRLSANLMARQNVSVYAARALPGLLHALDDGERLFYLAFDDRIPASITSTVGKRNVRYARLKAATRHAAIHKDYNRLVRLLVELSTLAAVDQRGSDYIRDHPDLAVAAKDEDARRRLFEIRTGWPGTRHARLTIANTLSGELDEAHRNATATSEWIDHHRRTSKSDGPREPGPDRTDIAAIALLLISRGRSLDAVRFLRGWRDSYAYEICEELFRHAALVQQIRNESPGKLAQFTDTLSDIGQVAAALSYQDLSAPRAKTLITALARRTKNNTKLYFPDQQYAARVDQLQDGLRKSSALALKFGLKEEALTISQRAPHKRPSIWSFRDAFYHHDVFPFLFRIALVAAVRADKLHEKDLLPRELAAVCRPISKTFVGPDFGERVKKRISAQIKKARGDADQDKTQRPELTYEQSQEAERFLERRLVPLLALTTAFSGVLGAGPRRGTKTFNDLVAVWKDSLKTRDPYRDGIDHFFLLLGLNFVMFALWLRSDLKPQSLDTFLAVIDQHAVGSHNLVRITSILAKRPHMQALAGQLAAKARTQIETEDEVTFRATEFAALARAMLPASLDEASAYFRTGLEQMDAIGSGDYEFTNELLLFASQMEGEELDECDFHTLSNICELNMGEEPEKFFWAAFGRGLSKAAGQRALAKLSRWDDRGKVSMNNTLLPYLTALLEHGKIDPRDALALNRLANPVEYYFAGSKEFAHALRTQAGADPELIGELINQFEDDNPDLAMDSTAEKLALLAVEALGPTAPEVARLAAARARYSKIRNALNARNSSSYKPDARTQRRKKRANKHNREQLQRIAADTDATDEAALVRAIDAFNSLGNMYDLKGEFFVALRDKVPYGKRAQYVRNVSRLENLFFYWKFAELAESRKAWQASSAGMEVVFREIAAPIIQLHAADLVGDGRFSGSSVKEISDFTGVPIADLILDLIETFARPDSEISGAIWLAFASLICPKADNGLGQLALKRLLTSDAARLANKVVDGRWEQGLYPPTDDATIAAGLIWRMLGSPYAVDRWRAAHSMRCFAKFDRWEVLDRLVEKIGDTSAGPFQAKELLFFHMHARLWLLIAVARLSLDYPDKIARYHRSLFSVVQEKEPHVLARSFAARALLACFAAGKYKPSADALNALKGADHSPFQRVKKKLRTNGGFYSGRPESVPEPQLEFGLDYDFHKHDVDSLAQVFGKPCWEVADLMSEIVRKIDPNVQAMHDAGGRESRYRHRSYEITTHYHTYGQQLGWHAVFLAAGNLLSKYPVTDDWLYDNPWEEWLGRYGLTRPDGLWLSDGTDRTPLDISVSLLEGKKTSFAITGAQQTILQLAGINSYVGKQLIVEGRWFSADNVRVRISSALVPPSKAEKFARALVREEPMISWVPCFYGSEEDDEYLRSEKKEYTPWIVCLSGESRLDEHDPYGVSEANYRARLARDFATFIGLTAADPFNRAWQDKRGRILLRAEVWGREDKHSEEGPYPGTRLFCSSSVLKKVLKKCKKDILLLINLQLYEKKTYERDSRYRHTVAAVRINESLDITYFKGRINHLHQLR